MQFKFFTIPAMSGDTERAEEELNRFLRGHRILSVQRELVSNGMQSGWCCCVEYLDGDGNSFGKSAYEKREKIDYREVLNEDEFARFRVMRDARKSIAETDVVPAYAIMIDEQLADLARLEKVDENALKKLNGFGDKKFEKYGKRFLDLIQGVGDEKSK